MAGNGKGGTPVGSAPSGTPHAWIEDFDYVPPTNRLSADGTLYYTVGSTLADKGGTPNFIDRFEVSVLSFRQWDLFNPPGVGPIAR